jgi:hypothetical protein
MRITALTALVAMAVAMSFSTARTQSPPPDALSRQKAALDVIRDFADGFCKTVPQSGKSESVEASGDAKANLNGLLKKLTDLGFQGAAKYKEEEWQGPLRDSLATMTKDNQTCRLEIWKDLQSKLLQSSASYVVPKLVQMLQGHITKNGRPYMAIEAIMQNESNRDFFVTKLILGKGFDSDEFMRILGCCLYCMEGKTYVFDLPIGFNSTNLQNENLVGFKDDDEPDLRYSAIYYHSPGCHSPLSYKITADVAFPIKSGGFTSVRLFVPEFNSDARKNLLKNTNNQLKKLASQTTLQPDMQCIEIVLDGDNDTLRSCKGMVKLPRNRTE